MSGPARTPAGTGAWRGYVALSLAWSILLAVVIFLNRRPATEPIVIVPPPTAVNTDAPAASTTATPSAPSPTPGPLVIDVAGAVRAPGVYRLPPGGIVADAIAAAGGAAADADLDRLNKAIALENRMQVYVPHRAEAETSGAGAQAGAVRQPPIVPAAPARAESAPAAEAAPEAGSAGGSELINLNTATLDQLDTLPGVGEVTAQKIVAGRPYGKIEDLLNVDGIGEAKLAKLRALITVR
jgi:competence protein ComEA